MSLDESRKHPPAPREFVCTKTAVVCDKSFLFFPWIVTQNDERVKKYREIGTFNSQMVENENENKAGNFCHKAAKSCPYGRKPPNMNKKGLQWASLYLLTSNLTRNVASTKDKKRPNSTWYCEIFFHHHTPLYIRAKTKKLRHRIWSLPIILLIFAHAKRAGWVCKHSTSRPTPQPALTTQT